MFAIDNDPTVPAYVLRRRRSFEIFNPNANPRFVRLLRIIKYLAVPRTLVSYCKYLLLSLCHGRGREFESRRPRHSFQAVMRKECFPRSVFNPNSDAKPIQAALFPRFLSLIALRNLPGTFAGMLRSVVPRICRVNPSCVDQLAPLKRGKCLDGFSYLLLGEPQVVEAL
jgi:hypothetical protein